MNDPDAFVERVMSEVKKLKGTTMSDETTEIALTPVENADAAMGRIERVEHAPAVYSAGFAGAASRAVSDEEAKVLMAPFPPSMVEIKPNGIVYLPWVFFQQRLNQAFKPGGSALVPRSPPRKVDDNVVYHGALYIQDRFISEAYGECECRAGMSWASAIEGARSDCRTRCCKELGIAMDLWDPSWREKWMAEYALKAFNPVKKKWMFWRKDREQPWEVKDAKSLPAAGTSAPLTPHDAPGDTGEAPMSDDLKDFIGLLDGVKWAKPKVKAWLDKYFGCTPDEFTKVQMKAACNMLLAWNKDPKGAYQETVAELQKLGVIRGPAVGPEAPI